MRHQRNHRYDGRPRTIPRPSAITPGAVRQLGVVVIALAMAWSVLILYAVHVELPVNALDLPFESSLKPPLQALVPQGWGFFTRDPREPRLLPFRREAGVWQAASEGPISGDEMLDVHEHLKAFNGSMRELARWRPTRQQTS